MDKISDEEKHMSERTYNELLNYFNHKITVLNKDSFKYLSEESLSIRAAVLKESSGKYLKELEQSKRTSFQAVDSMIDWYI